VIVIVIVIENVIENVTPLVRDEISPSDWAIRFHGPRIISP